MQIASFSFFHSDILSIHVATFKDRKPVSTFVLLIYLFIDESDLPNKHSETDIMRIVELLIANIFVEVNKVQ